MRFACNQLEAPLDKAQGWSILGDATISIGKHKTLVIVGAKIKNLIDSGCLTLKFSDLTILSLYTSSTINSAVVAENGEKALERIGGSADSFTTDQGGEMRKGGRFLLSTHPEMKHIHDIAHKMALLVKKGLKNDPQWASYLTHELKTRRKIQQTELAAIKPPNMQIKARYMNVDIHVKWYIKTDRMIAAGRLKEIGVSKTRFYKYFGWFKEYKEFMTKWSQIFLIVDSINNYVRKKGLSETTYDNLLILLSKANDANDEQVKTFMKEALASVYEEVKKLELGQTVLGSTEIVESYFGVYKMVGITSGQGVNSHALAMGNLIGKCPSSQEIVQAMETCSIKKALDLVKRTIGDGIGNLRRIFYRKLKAPTTEAPDEHSSQIQCSI